MKPNTLALAGTLLFLAIQPHPAWMDLKTDVGFERLTSNVAAAPTGAGVTVTQVEAVSNDHWMPDSANPQFSGKTITDRTGGDTGSSVHATQVGTYFYGNDGSIAPGITQIETYEANDWIGAGYLAYGVTLNGNPIQPIYSYSLLPFQRILASPSRVANHSWAADSDACGNMLRRLDFVIAADNFVQIAAVNNGTVHKPLLSESCNAITVGRTDGYHPTGTTAIDAVYRSGRQCPLIVVPLELTSHANPVVASAVSLLIEAGRQTDLGNDPEETSIYDRSGRAVANAERSTTVKAALLAGARRMTYNTSTTDQISDYRSDPVNRSANGLAVRYGAGQLDVYNSYRIIAGGEQNSAEDSPANGGVINDFGFDVDPYFGGLSGSNISGTYQFTAGPDARRLYVSLVWHLKIDGGSWNDFDDTATGYDLNLILFDTSSGNDRQIASSDCTVNNTENLWTAIVPGRSYRIEVLRADGQADFLMDYAVAWRMETPADTDGDRLDDEWEVAFGLDYSNWDSDSDNDSDGLPALEEYQAGTAPDLDDTDGDGVLDGAEISGGSDPLDPEDVPGLNVPVGSGASIVGLLILLGIGWRSYAVRMKPGSKNRH